MSNVRILERENAVVGIDDIQQHPANPNQGDETTLDGSIDTNGLYRSIVVQRSTGYILAGNTTHRVAKSKGATEIAAEYIDVDDEAAKRILLVDNGARRNARNDDRLLAEALAELPNLDGTGYDPGDLEAITTLLTPTASTELENLDDESVLDSTDRAGWPIIRAQVPPELHQRWLLVDGDDDAARIRTLLDVTGH